MKKTTLIVITLLSYFTCVSQFSEKNTMFIQANIGSYTDNYHFYYSYFNLDESINLETSIALGFSHAINKNHWLGFNIYINDLFYSFSASGIDPDNSSNHSIEAEVYQTYLGTCMTYDYNLVIGNNLFVKNKSGNSNLILTMGTSLGIGKIINNRYWGKTKSEYPSITFDEIVQSGYNDVYPFIALFPRFQANVDLKYVFNGFYFSSGISGIYSRKYPLLVDLEIDKYFPLGYSFNLGTGFYF